MIFKNFNNLQKLDVELFKRDKHAAISTACAFLTAAQLKDSKINVKYDELIAGYIIAEDDDLIIDTDDVKATAFIKDLLQSVPNSYAIQRTKKGYHFFFRLAKGHGFSGKKIIKFKEIKIELMGAGMWVFGGSALSDYYEDVSNLTPADCETLDDVDSALLMQQILTLGDVDYKTGAFSTPLPQKPYSMPKKAAFVSRVLTHGTLKECDYKEFEYLFRFCLGIEYNPYNPTAFISEGYRNITLLKIFTDLLRCAECEDVHSILSFLSIVARDFCRPAYPQAEVERSFNLKRLQGANALYNFTRADLTNARPDPFFSPVTIALDLSPDAPTQNPYYLIKTNEYGEEVLQPIGRGDRVLRAEIMNDSFLSNLYLSFNPKTARHTLNFDSIPTIRIDNRDKCALSPFVPFKTQNGATVVYNLESQHYTRHVRHVRDTVPISQEEFENLPIVKMAIENLYPSPEAFEFHMSEFYRVFRDCDPTNKIFTFLGEGGIGKDTWFDFLAYAFIENFVQIYKKTQSDFIKDAWGYADTASMIILSESGETTESINSTLFSKLNRIVSNRKITVEKKFAAPRAQDVCLFSCLVSSNNVSLNIQDYNNTRVVVFRCPAERTLRNSKENQRYFFANKSLLDVYRDCAEKFVSFVLTNDVYYKKHRDTAISDIDSSSLVAQTNATIYAANDVLNFIDTLSIEFAQNSADTLIQMCSDPENYTFKTNPKLKRFAFRIYANLMISLGADISFVEKTLGNVNDECLFDKKHDRTTTRLYGICDTMRLAYKSAALHYNMSQIQSIIQEKIIRHVSDSKGAWRFKKTLLQRYEFVGTQIQTAIF